MELDGLLKAAALHYRPALETRRRLQAAVKFSKDKNAASREHRWALRISRPTMAYNQQQTLLVGGRLGARKKGPVNNPP